MNETQLVPTYPRSPRQAPQEGSKQDEIRASTPMAGVSARLSLWTKLVYGSGDWGLASFGTIRQVFYAIFLTDVVGLEPRLASAAVLIGIIWDAINDRQVRYFSPAGNA